jgi:hypothetical protein
MEVIEIEQKLRINNHDSQYWLANWFYFIYDNKIFGLRVDCFGNNNKKILDGSETLNMTTDTYLVSYNIASQLKFLKNNFIDTPIFNRNNIKFSRFVADWASGSSSDYYGLYFQIPNDNFSECIISIYNIWHSFARNQKLLMDNNPDYKEKYMMEGGSLKNIFQLLELLEESLSFTISNNIINITNEYNYRKYNSDDSFIRPKIKNLRMRREPSLNSEVLGYMADSLYQIVIIGKEDKIDGIKGNWLLIKPGNSNNLTWVFSGYTRKATEKEIFNYFPH